MDAALETEVMGVTFGGCAGAIHRPIGEPNCGVAVVLCPPAGREARCAYRPLFHWAEALAGQGFHVLRYDHLGEGDSLELAREADQWACWVDGLAQAAEFARAHTGARELVVAGLRVGATLALAAAERVKPDGLILLAPLPTGDAWLRDLRLASAIQNVPPTPDGSIEVDGLRLSPATIRTLETVDVSRVEPTWRAALLAPTASGRTMADGLGRTLATTPFEGYGKLFKEPHVNAAPKRVFEAATAWLERFAADVGPPTAALAPPPAQLASADWIERPAAFGPGLRGVLCLPAAAESRRAVIFGNTACDPRAGVGNFTAHACRALAGAGIAALRFDFLGVGESGERDDGPPHVYETDRLAEYEAAAQLLRDHGYDEITLVGVCTGGYHAVRAVLAESGFHSAIAFNSWLVWRPGMQLERRSDAAQGKVKPASGARPANRWIRLLRGEAEAVAALSRRAKQFWSSLRPDAPCRAVRAEISRASRRGERIHVVLGRGDACMLWLEAEFGFDCRWLARRRGVSVSLIPNLDHALFSIESQQKAIAEMFRILGLQRRPPAPEPARLAA